MKTLAPYFMVVLCFISTQAWSESTDNREIIWVSDAEKTALLTEMRNFLSASQQILAAALSEEVDAIEAAARPVGIKLMKNTPDALKAKLPKGFGKLGSKTHLGFENIANEASGMGDTTLILQQLATLQTHCIACHARYQFKVTQIKK